MADPRHPDRDPGADLDGDAAPDPRLSTGVPRWVVAVGVVIAVALVVLIAALHLSGVIGPGTYS